MSQSKRDEDHISTLPSPPSIPREFKARTPAPAGTRRLSGAMVFRFEEALNKLQEGSKKIDEKREEVRELCTDEEKESFEDITGTYRVPESEKKE